MGRLGRGTSVRPKSTPRAGRFAEQLKQLEEQHRFELVLAEDVQEFVRARAKLEMEYAQSLQKLANQQYAKRKWPDFSYSKGHDNILLIDLWRSTYAAHAAGRDLPRGGNNTPPPHWRPADPPAPPSHTRTAGLTLLWRMPRPRRLRQSG